MTRTDPINKVRKNIPRGLNWLFWGRQAWEVRAEPTSNLVRRHSSAAKGGRVSSVFIGEPCVWRHAHTAVNTPKQRWWCLPSEHRGTYSQTGMLIQIVHAQPCKPSTVCNVVFRRKVGVIKWYKLDTHSNRTIVIVHSALEIRVPVFLYLSVEWRAMLGVSVFTLCKILPTSKILTLGKYLFISKNKLMSRLN